MTAQAISVRFFGVSNSGDCAGVQASALGRRLSTREMRRGAARLGKQLCCGLQLRDPV